MKTRVERIRTCRSILCLLAITAGWSPAALGQEDDIADVADNAYRVPGNSKWMYVEIEAAERSAEPSDGYKLLLVLPGGDGGRDFMPFVKRIYKHALPPDYVVVELMAPRWARSEQIVWPLAKDGAAAAKIATEEFIAAVVEDVAKRRTINRKCVFALGWSSGGPPLYAAALAAEPAVTGVIPAMSVFHPHRLPPIANAKGRPFFILHSPQDDVCPFTIAQEARDALAEAGAAVELLQYEGGHGWRGNVYGNISAGVTWLEQQVAD